MEVKAAWLRHRDSGGPLGPGAFMRYLQAGNDVLRRSFGESFGRVEQGYKADLVILDYDSPRPSCGKTSPAMSSSAWGAGT